MEDAEALFSLLFCCFYLFAILLGIATFIFWILMLIDAIRREYPNENDKIIWIIVIALTGWIGALLYFFVGRKTRN